MEERAAEQVRMAGEAKAQAAERKYGIEEIRAAMDRKQAARRAAVQAEVARINSTIKAREEERQAAVLIAREVARSLAHEEVEHINAKIQGALVKKL